MRQHNKATGKFPMALRHTIYSLINSIRYRHSYANQLLSVFLSNTAESFKTLKGETDKTAVTFVRKYVTNK
jgi:hypothetical protein